MGLDTSHGAWHGAYRAFSRWRNAVAVAAGYAVWEVKYNNGMTMDTIMLDWGHAPDGSLYGEWDETPSDPLLVLFMHSDCGGVINPAQAGPLADALESLLDAMQTTGEGHIHNYRATTEQFIAGLREAAANNEPLTFG